MVRFWCDEEVFAQMIEAVDEGHRGREHHQQIHARRPSTQLTPATHEESRACPDEGHGSEDSGDERLRECHRRPHHQHHHDEREDDCHQRLALQGALLPLTKCLQLAHLGFIDTQIIAHGSHSCTEHLGGTLRLIIDDKGRGGGEVDGGGLHARRTLQGLRRMSGAGCAVKSQEGERSLDHME